MAAERTSEGFGPINTVNAQDSAAAAIRAPLRPRIGAARKETRAARMPRCWPESAKTWEHPALRKASESSVSSSSRTPSTRASRRGPPSPPARIRADSIPPRSPARSRAPLPEKPLSRRSSAFAKSTHPVPPRSGAGRPDTRSTVPAGIDRPVRATITVRFPRAEARIPSPPPEDFRHRTRRRPPVLRGTESSAAVPSAHSTNSGSRPKEGGAAASPPALRARKARTRAAAAVRRRSLRVPGDLARPPGAGRGLGPAQAGSGPGIARAAAQRARAAARKAVGARPGGARQRHAAKTAAQSRSGETGILVTEP